MALLTRNCRMQERPAAVLSRAPKLLVQVGEVLANGGLSVPDEVGLAETGTDEVHDNFCTRYGNQACETTDGHDLQELGQCVSGTAVSARSRGEGPAIFQLHSLLGYVRFHHWHRLMIHFHQRIILDLVPLRLGVEAKSARNDHKMGQDAKPLRTLAHLGQQ